MAILSHLWPTWVSTQTFSALLCWNIQGVLYWSNSDLKIKRWCPETSMYVFPFLLIGSNIGQLPFIPKPQWVHVV
jgi:hypothetical protein